MRREVFEEEEFYHVYNRGVDKKIIFPTDRERLRFINSLYILNNFVNIPTRFDIFKLEPREMLTQLKEPHVKIVAVCLMPTHYHLMLTPLKKDGISIFLQKIGLSFTHYFNRLHERKGRLFETTFKAKHIDRHEYASYLTQYIHLNPLKLYSTKYGTSVIDWLKRYKWSSLPVYLGEESPVSTIISISFLNEVLGMSTAEYKNLLHETVGKGV